MEPRSVRESQIQIAQVMLPSDANPLGNVHGGAVMKLIDNAGGVAAARHCRCEIATVRIDEISFHDPVHVGDLVTLRAAVNGVGRTSMEVGVRVEAEDLMTGQIKHTASAFLVYVALDASHAPVDVPPLVAETDEDRRRMREAAERRARRLAGAQADR